MLEFLNDLTTLRIIPYSFKCLSMIAKHFCLKILSHSKFFLRDNKSIELTHLLNMISNQSITEQSKFFKMYLSFKYYFDGCVIKEVT